MNYFKLCIFKSIAYILSYLINSKRFRFVFTIDNPISCFIIILYYYLKFTINLHYKLHLFLKGAGEN